MDPKIPMANPTSFAKEMAEACGRFYTQGMPEDTKALAAGLRVVSNKCIQTEHERLKIGPK